MKSKKKQVKQVIYIPSWVFEIKGEKRVLSVINNGQFQTFKPSDFYGKWIIGTEKLVEKLKQESIHCEVYTSKEDNHGK